ncbi:MAG: MFS transporter [Deltaproteobacteria bacterium]|nr:MFS transporter [Deltaproteobacteria bacterium]
MEKKEKKIMGLTTSSHFLVHLIEGVLPPLIPLVMLEFNADYSQMGLIVAIFSYAFGLFAIPAGIISDKIYPRHLITIFLIGTGLFTIMVFNVTSIVGYGIIMGITGIFAAIYHPAANTLIANSIKKKGEGFGLHGIAGSIGVASAPAISAFIGTVAGWRTPHIVYGTIGIAIAIFSFTIPKNNITPQVSAQINNMENNKKKSYYPLILFFCTAIFLGLTYRGIMTFLPIYMGENVHFNFVQSNKIALGGVITTLTLLSGAIGQYISGKLTDKYPPEKIYVFAVLFGAVFVFAIAFTTNIILILSAMLYAFFYFAVQPIQNYIISIYLPVHKHGTGYGILFMLMFGVGSTAALISGYMADKFGLSSIFYLMGVFYAIAAFIAYMLYRTSKKGKI